VLRALGSKFFDYILLESWPRHGTLRFGSPPQGSTENDSQRTQALLANGKLQARQAHLHKPNPGLVPPELCTYGRFVAPRPTSKSQGFWCASHLCFWPRCGCIEGHSTVWIWLNVPGSWWPGAYHALLLVLCYSRGQRLEPESWELW